MILKSLHWNVKERKKERAEKQRKKSKGRAEKEKREQKHKRKQRVRSAGIVSIFFSLLYSNLASLVCAIPKPVSSFALDIWFLFEQKGVMLARCSFPDFESNYC